MYFLLVISINDERRFITHFSFFDRFLNNFSQFVLKFVCSLNRILFCVVSLNKKRGMSNILISLFLFFLFFASTRHACGSFCSWRLINSSYSLPPAEIIMLYIYQSHLRRKTSVNTVFMNSIWNVSVSRYDIHFWLKNGKLLVSIAIIFSLCTKKINSIPINYTVVINN